MPCLVLLVSVLIRGDIVRRHVPRAAGHGQQSRPSVSLAPASSLDMVPVAHIPSGGLCRTGAVQGKEGRGARVSCLPDAHTCLVCVPIGDGLQTARLLGPLAVYKCHPLRARLRAGRPPFACCPRAVPRVPARPYNTTPTPSLTVCTGPPVEPSSSPCATPPSFPPSRPWLLCVALATPSRRDHLETSQRGN